MWRTVTESRSFLTLYEFLVKGGPRLWVGKTATNIPRKQDWEMVGDILWKCFINKTNAVCSKMLEKEGLFLNIVSNDVYYNYLQ